MIKDGYSKTLIGVYNNLAASSSQEVLAVVIYDLNGSLKLASVASAMVALVMTF